MTGSFGLFGAPASEPSASWVASTPPAAPATKRPAPVSRALRRETPRCSVCAIGILLDILRWPRSIRGVACDRHSRPPPDRTGQLVKIFSAAFRRGGSVYMRQNRRDSKACSEEQETVGEG